MNRDDEIKCNLDKADRLLRIALMLFVISAILSIAGMILG